MEKNVNAPVKKATGNKTTEIIIGSAAVKLQNAVKSAYSALEEVKNLDVKAQEGTLKVSDLEDKIGGLKQDLENKTAQNKIDLQQAYDADKKAFVDNWLKENNVVVVDDATYKNLQNELASMEVKMESTVRTEVGKAVGIEKANSANALKIAQLEAEKKEASNVAEISQLKAQIMFLEKTSKSWEDALTAERAAGIERAKASSINTLNVGGTTQGR
jgi:hypothetical protein